MSAPLEKQVSQKQFHVSKSSLQVTKSQPSTPYLKLSDVGSPKRGIKPFNTKSSRNIIRLSSNEIDVQAQNLQSGQCKLIFIPKPEPLDKFGFTTFTEMMKTNTTWVSQAPQLASTRNSNHATEQDEVQCANFPVYLTNRLKFNKTQTINFKASMEQRWEHILEEANTVTQKHQRRNVPKVKLIQQETKTQEDSEEKVEVNKDKLEHDAMNAKLRNLKIFWYSISITEHWKPSIREGCTISFIETSPKCLLYGGIGRDLFASFVSLNTRTWQWQDIGHGTGDTPLDGRFGHTATPYKKSIVIFGGERKYNSALKMRECYSDVRLYLPQTHSWQYQRTYGDVAEARRNHCAAICGKFFFITGGVNSYGKYLNDVVSLNLETLKWFNYELSGQDDQGMAFAAGISLFAAEIKLDNPYLTYEYVRKKGKKLIKLGEEGFFVFGGRLGNGEATSDLRVIKLGSKPLQIKTIETKGVGPTPRYMHTMNYFEPLNFCVIYGGRDDSVTSASSSNIKNDMFIIEMESFNWIQVSFVGMPDCGKCSHSAVFMDTKLLIFGGYSTDSFKNSDIQLVEFDQQKTRLMIKDMRQRYPMRHNQQLILTLQDIQNDVTLKMFTMDNNSSLRALQQHDEASKYHNSQNQRISYSNFKSFMPLPLQEQSTLMKEFKLKKELEKSQLPESKTGFGSRIDSRKASYRSKLHDNMHSKQISEGDTTLKKQPPPQIGENPDEESDLAD